VDNVFGVELLKTRKRWMPYTLFLVMVVGVLFIIFAAGFFAYRDNPIEEPGARLTFAFPFSIHALLDSGQFWGAMLVGILAASVMATEYNWGTVRQVLIRGQSRRRFLAVKLLVISLMSAVMLLAALFLGILLSIYTSDVEGFEITLDVPDGPSIPEIIVMILRAGWCIVPYGMLAFMLATVGRSGTLGIGGIVIFLFGEAIAMELLDSLGPIGRFLKDISVGQNVNSLIAENRIGTGEYNSISLREQGDPSELASPNVAALIITVHTVVYMVIAFAVFERRDVKV
jgi:ABC-type transport system involved in multi-copper enzyme maturation permease subunit